MSTDDLIVEMGERNLALPFDAFVLVDAGDVLHPMVSTSCEGRPGDAVAVCFLDELPREAQFEANRDPDAFWKPWVDRSLAAAKLLMVDEETPGVEQQKVILWIVRDGVVPPGPFVSRTVDLSSQAGLERAMLLVQSTHFLLRQFAARLPGRRPPPDLRVELRHHQGRRPQPHALRRGDPRLKRLSGPDPRGKKR